MSSLTEQLERLRAPQISQAYVDKTKYSLLYCPKEAAALDREDVYEVGLKGLQELIAINPKFRVFKRNLFDHDSISMEREMHTKEDNTKLDEIIKQFLYLLSPYFQLKPAHEALEWLIHRFSIQKYNMDDFFKLILPYHDTTMFVKVLKLFKINQPTNKWVFLKPLQRTDHPLSKTTLYNHIASDLGFLKFIIEMTEEIFEVFKDTPHQISTLNEFYCRAIIGMIQYSKQVGEEQLTQVLPLLTRGISSDIDAFVASNLKIFAVLLRKTKLSETVLQYIMNILSKFKLTNLRQETVIILIIIFQTQSDILKHFSQKVLNRLCTKEWLPETLNEHYSSNVYLDPFISSLIEDSLISIQTNDDDKAEKMRIFTLHLVQRINFNKESAMKVIEITLDHFQNDLFQPDLKNLEVGGIPYTIKNQSLFNWYSQFLRQLERRFPEAFDLVVKSAINDRRKQLNTLLGLVSDFPLHLSSNAMFENLLHPKPEIRLPAIKYLSVNYGKLKANEKEMIFPALTDILSDSDVFLIHTVLNIEKHTLIEIFERETLFKHLINFAATCWTEQKTWKEVTSRVLDLLCSELFVLSDLTEARTLIAILPFLLDKKMKNYHTFIISSDFFKNNLFLQDLNEVISNSKTTPISEITSKLLISSKHVPSLSILRELAHQPLSNAEKYFITLLLVGINHEQAMPFVSQNILEIFETMVNQSMLKNAFMGSESMEATDSACLEAVKKGLYPAPALIHIFRKIIKVTQISTFSENFGSWLDLGNLTVNGYLMKIFKILVEGINKCTEQKQLRAYYIKTLKLFFEKYFPSSKARLNFLANLFVLQELIDSRNQVYNYNIQLNALKIANALLPKEKIDVIQWICSNESIFIPALLIALTSSLAPLRHEAVNILETLSQNQQPSKNSEFNILIQKLVEHSNELRVDAQQLLNALYSILSPDQAIRSLFKKSEAAQLDQSLKSLIAHVSNHQETPLYISAALLDSLSFVNCHTTVFVPISTLIDHILNEKKENPPPLTKYQSRVILNIINRFNEKMITNLNETQFNKSFLRFLSEHKTRIHFEKKPTLLCIPMMDQISRDLYETLSEPFRKTTLNTIINSASEANQPEVIYASRRFFKKIYLDGQLASEILIEMLNAQLQTSKIGKTLRSINTCPPKETINTFSWKRGITLLENIQNKKKILHRSLLLNALYNLLKKCLEFQDQSFVEYTKQLVLTSIHQCCINRVDPEQVKTLLVEPVVQCIRASENSQTHHDALILLTQLTQYKPDDVLFHIMTIFTLMAPTIRQDDNFSFNIISKIIDNIFPHLIKKENSSENSSEVVQIKIDILRKFADSLVNIPVHRRKFLYEKVITTLGVRQTLWLLITLIIENQATHDSTNAQEKQEFILNFTLSFEPEDILSTCTLILKYIHTLPINKEEFARKFSFKKSVNLFDTENHTDKQLRHFRYALCTFISSLLSSPEFLRKVADLSTEETENLKITYQNLIETSLEYIQNVGTICESTNQTIKQYWRTLLNVTHDILDNINALLPSEMLVKMLGYLLDHPNAALRRKSIDLLNARLKHGYFSSKKEQTALVSLVDPLHKIVISIQENTNTVPTTNSTEKELNQMRALVSLKYLARVLLATDNNGRVLAPDNVNLFIPVIDLISSLTSSDLPRGNMIASLLVCLSDLCQSIGTRSIQYLPKFMPAIISCLNRENKLHKPDVKTQAIITALHKLFTTKLPEFMNPYLSELMYEISLMSITINENEKEDTEQSSKTQLKLKAIRQIIGSKIPARTLVSPLDGEFDHLLKTKSFKSVGPLLQILVESFGHMSRTELIDLHTPLSKFFFKALNYRSDFWDNVTTPEENVEHVALVENAVIDALVRYILKSNDDSFRSFFNQLFFWAKSPEASQYRLITFYKLTEKIASKLKGVFIHYAGIFIKHASELLKNLKSPEPIFEVLDSANKCQLLEGVLKTLYLVFLYDSQRFINKERFESLMEPLVDQLENMCGGPSELERRATEFVVPAVAQMAVAVADDNLWKQLINHILFKTRHTSTQVRLVSLQAFSAIAKNLGQDFFPFLPETVPFLAELLEEEDETIEAACTKVIQELEEVLGEPLKTFFYA